jgi:hypothetical protein
MQVNKKIVQSALIVIGLFIPLFGSLVFPDFYMTNNSRINDLMFGIRFTCLGKETISPYLSVINIDDDFTDLQGYGERIGTAISRISNNPSMPYFKTVLVNLSYPEKIRIRAETGFLKTDDNTGNLFTPILITRSLQDDEGERNNDSLKNISFHLAFHKEGAPINIDPDALSIKAIDLEYPKTGAGIYDLSPDKDGIVRRLPLVFREKEGSRKYLLSFVLAALCHYFDVEPGNIIIDFARKIVLPKAKFRSLEKDLCIPIDNQGRMIINFPGTSNSSFIDLSASKLLEQDDVSTSFPLKTRELTESRKPKKRWNVQGWAVLPGQVITQKTR